MSELLLYYQRPEPATWVYLSSFLAIGLFFMFHRFWSMRNLDVLLLLMLAPGLMMVYEGRKLRYAELDGRYRQSTADASRPAMARVGDTNRGQHENANAASKTSSIYYVAKRAPAFENQFGDQAVLGNMSGNPWLTQAIQTAVDVLAIEEQENEPPIENLLPTNRVWSADQLEFWGFIFLLTDLLLILIRLLIDATLVRRPMLEPNLSIGGLTFLGISLFLFLMANVAISSLEEQRQQGPRLGPGYSLLHALPNIQTVPEGKSATPQENHPSRPYYSTIAKTIAIAANLAIVMGIVGVGYWHFDDTKMGIGAATLYLLLPYSAIMTGRIDHVLPGAMLVWAVLMYRLPIVSGIFLGMAAGLTYYPLFLLPLWLSFYWHRGIRRFLGGFTITILLLASLLLIRGTDRLVEQLQQMFGIVLPAMADLQGVWGLGWNPSFRLPVLVAFCILSYSFIWWPAQKNLATLLSGSAAVMVAAQFWHGFGGGLYMSWFLPLVLLTVFRPNLDDRVALEVVGDGWWGLAKSRSRPALGIVQGINAA